MKVRGAIISNFPWLRKGEMNTMKKLIVVSACATLGAFAEVIFRAGCEVMR